MTNESKNTTGSAVSVWDNAASSYEASRSTDPVYSSCIDLVAQEAPNGSAMCIDAGCGTGLQTKFLAGRCGIVIGVDYSFESLKILKNKGLQNVIVVQADLTSLPFKKSAFDSCVCANTLNQFRPDGVQERAVSELERVTKENGILCVSVHHFSKTKQKAGWIKEGKPGQPGIDYIYRFDREELLRLIPGSRIRGVGYYRLLKVPFLGSRLQNKLATLFGRVAAILGYGHMLIAVSKKRT